MDAILDNIDIKVADPNDLPEVFLIVDDYAEDLPIDRTRVKNYLREILYCSGVLLGNYRGKVIGGVAGYAVPNMLTEEIMFVVMFFFIRKQYRQLTGRFIKELELALLPTKCNRITFGAMNTPRGNLQQRYLKMHGYSVLETHLSKRLG